MEAIQLRTTTTIALTQKEEGQRAHRLAVALEQRLQAFEKLINHVEQEIKNSDRGRYHYLLLGATNNAKRY